MRNKSVIFSLFDRSVWFLLALLVMVSWGPVKKLAELKTDKAPVASVTIDKKLHSGCRNTHEIKELVKKVSMAAFLPAHNQSAACSSHSVYFSHVNYPKVVLAGLYTSIPAYLRLRKILV